MMWQLQVGVIMGLTAKQHRFIDEYLIDLNATQAAIRAGYSKKTAYSQGERLLRHAEVAATVEAGKAALAKLTLITAEEVIAGLRREAEYHGEGASHSARVSAWGHLAKIAGAAIERHQHTHQGGIRLVWERADA